MTPVAAEATQFDYSKSRSFPNVFSPYKVPSVAEPRLNNGRRLEDLIGGGKLLLTLSDAIALALENNLDIAVSRYDLPIAQTDLLRAKGGGVGSAGGVGPSGAGGVLGGGTDRVSSVPCCDPTLHVSYGWCNALTPLNYTVVSGVPVDITHEMAVSTGYSQGFLSGTSLFVSGSSSSFASNTKTSIFNPEFVSGVFVGLNQHLLRGFGTKSNARFIRIARNDVKYSASVFRQDVMAAVAGVETTYYDLLADRESIRVATGGLAYARR